MEEQRAKEIPGSNILKFKDTVRLSCAKERAICPDQGNFVRRLYLLMEEKQIRLVIIVSVSTGHDRFG
jgi:hypothetical protein